MGFLLRVPTFAPFALLYLEICSPRGDFERAATTEDSRYAEGVEESSPGLREFDERYPGYHHE